MTENRTCPDRKWGEIPTAELDKILQTELEKGQPDEKVVLPILKELEDREKDYPVATEEVIALGRKLQADRPQRTPRRRNWVIVASAAAAVLCIVMALPRTVGAESIFGALFRWTSSVFQFVDPNSEEDRPKIDKTFTTDNPGLQKLYEEVANLGVDEAVVPAWLPEGYELTSLKTMLVSSGTKINAVFEQGDEVILLTYKFTSETITKIEKEDSAVEVIEYANVSHFVLENDGNFSVAWKTNDIEGLIIASTEKENIDLIIKSIYGRVLQ